MKILLKVLLSLITFSSIAQTAVNPQQTAVVQPLGSGTANGGSGTFNGVFNGNGVGLTNLSVTNIALVSTNSNGLQSSNDFLWRQNIPANYSYLSEPTPRMSWISWPNASSGINESIVKI